MRIKLDPTYFEINAFGSKIWRVKHGNSVLLVFKIYFTMNSFE